MTPSKFVLLLLASFLVLGGGSAGADQELIVSTAASLTNGMKAVAQQFEKMNPGVRIVGNLASSGVLLQQLDKGAPADLFAAADQQTMNQAQEKKLIRPKTRRNFVSNQLVLIAPRDSRLAVSSLNDLTRPEFKRVALGNPATVPAGRYAKEALVKAGLWNQLSAKYIFGETVRQVLDYVRRGEVDLGFVYSTDVVIAQGKVKKILVVTGHQPIIYPIALVASTGKPDLARRYLEFVLSPAAQEIFSKFGFGKP
jgi:molybdate transport system substrate-binding protein